MMTARYIAPAATRNHLAGNAGATTAKCNVPCAVNGRIPFTTIYRRTGANGADRRALRIPSFPAAADSGKATTHFHHPLRPPIITTGTNWNLSELGGIPWIAKMGGRTRIGGVPGENLRFC